MKMNNKVKLQQTYTTNPTECTSSVECLLTVHRVSDVTRQTLDGQSMGTCNSSYHLMGLVVFKNQIVSNPNSNRIHLDGFVDIYHKFYLPYQITMIHITVHNSHLIIIIMHVAESFLDSFSSILHFAYILYNNYHVRMS